MTIAAKIKMITATFMMTNCNSPNDDAGCVAATANCIVT